jgi:hypothetical protein
MTEINKLLKNKFGINRESKPIKKDKWLKTHLSIEEDLLLQQQLVEAKEKSIEEQPKSVEEKSLSEEDAKKLGMFSELIRSFGVEIEPEIIEEDLQLQTEDIKPVPVVVSQTPVKTPTRVIDKHVWEPVDITEAVKLVKDLPTDKESIKETQQLIADVVNNLEDMKSKTEVKEQVDEIDALRGEFNTLQKQVRQSQITIGGLSGSGGGLDPNKIAHSLLPAADDTFDLGSASKQWRNLYLGGSTLIVDGASLAADELSVLDSITAGTVAASKAVIVDSNKDISGFRNVTLTGDLTVSGDDITMGTNTAGHIMVADGTNFNPVAVSGDVTLASNGAVTIANTSVTNAMLAGSIANAKLSNSSITVADGSSTTAISLGGTITFSGTSNEVTVGESSGTITVGLPDDVTIAGDLTVNGDTTTVNTATLSVEDPLIKLANGNNSSDSLDVGFYGLYDTSGSQDLFAGLFRDANDSGKFKLFKDLQAEPTTTVNTSGTGYAVATLVANLEGTIQTAAQTNITSLGTLTTLTVDSIIINGTNIGHTSNTDAIAIASDGVVTFSQVPVLPADTIETADIQDNAVTPAKIAGAVNAQTGTAYTSVIGDAFKTVTMSNGSANKLTIPPNSSVAYAIGDRIDVVMLGSGTTSIQGGSGVTVNGVSTGTVAIAAQFAAVSCLKIATDTWVAMGNHGGVS